MNENLNTTRQRPDFAAAVWAGLIAGVVFLVLEMIMVPLFLDGSAWDPWRKLAALLLGADALVGLGEGGIGGGVFITALLVLAVLSIVYALITALVLDRLRFWPAVGTGAVFGLLLYWINTFVLAAGIEWLATSRNWVTTFTHIAFGIGAAAAYKGLERPEHPAGAGPLPGPQEPQRP